MVNSKRYFLVCGKNRHMIDYKEILKVFWVIFSRHFFQDTYWRYFLILTCSFFYLHRCQSDFLSIHYTWRKIRFFFLPLMKKNCPRIVSYFLLTHSRTNAFLWSDLGLLWFNEKTLKTHTMPLSLRLQADIDWIIKWSFISQTPSSKSCETKEA